MSIFCRILLIRKDTNSPPGKKIIYGATVHFQTDIVSFFECFNPRCPKIVPKLLKRCLKTVPMLSQSDPKVFLKFSQICLNIVAKLFQDPSDAQMLSV